MALAVHIILWRVAGHIALLVQAPFLPFVANTHYVTGARLSCL
jgi:hypothetical protein